jgi:hypothetical protein
MKITKSQLKQIILEELKEWLPPGGYMDQATKSDLEHNLDMRDDAASKQATPADETETLAQYLQDRYRGDKAGIKKFLEHQIREIIKQYAGLQSAYASGEFQPIFKAAKELGIEIPREAYRS